MNLAQSQPGADQPGDRSENPSTGQDVPAAPDAGAEQDGQDEPPQGLAATPPGPLDAVPLPVLDLHRAIAACEDPANPTLAGYAPVVAALSPVATLVAIACTGDAREATYRLYVLETGEIGGVHPLFFALPSKSLGWAGTDLLRTVAVGADGRLTGLFRDPNDARCLSRGTWRWTGYAFALESASVGSGCGGGGAAGWRQVYPPPP